MKTITITQKDIEKAKIQNSPSGMLIDELAFSAGQWTSEDLYSNNFDYEPHEPYEYDFEGDLFERTKTADGLYTLARTLGVSLNANWERIAKEQGLEAGACVALNNPIEWEVLLEEYTNNLKENGTESISEAYNKELQEEKDSFHDDQYKEWLNGDHSNYAGVVYEIAKYFTDERKGSYNRKDHEYTFTLNEYDIETAKDHGYNKNQLKAWLIDSIASAGNARASKEKVENEKRKAERARLAEYKKKQAEEAEARRKEKLLARKA